MEIEFERRCWAEIDLDKLRHNFKLIQKTAADAEIMAVVKANAYGHGDLAVAHALAQAGAQQFAVSGLLEAVRLRRSGLQQPVLVLGHTQPQHAEQLSRYNISQCVFSARYAQQLSQAAQQAGVEVKVHFKVDTGMGRLGFYAKDDIDTAVQALAQSCDLPGLAPEGLFTHFSVADSLSEEDKAYTQRQSECLLQVRDALQRRGKTFRWVHCCNSAGIVTQPHMHLDVVRPGIVLYGCAPSREVSIPGLQPAFKLKTVVTMVKDVARGASLSYGRTFTAPRAMRVATLAVGYADGYSRLMSSCGVVGICGKPARILGRVCMDQLVVDVTDIEQAALGSIATVFGGDGADSVDEVAEKCQTINYEVLCNIGRRVQRVYVENGQETQLTNYMEDHR